MTPQIAFLGIGLMGQAMTENLVKHGRLEEPIILYNRTQSQADEHSLRIGHSVAVHTLHEAISRSDIIWSCLQNEVAVTEMFDEILNKDIKGKLFLECSTVLPDVTSRLTQRILEAGAEFVAMPVFGEPSLAKLGKLICVPAGAASSVQRIRPFLLGVVGQAVVDLSGEEPAKASLLKVIGNVLIMTTMETVAEAHVFAEKTGLGTGHMQNLIATLFPRPPHTIYSAKMVSGDYYQQEPMVEIHKARDLASHVLQLANETNTSLKSYEVAVNHLASAETHAGPACDITSIYGAIRVESGLPFKNHEA